MIGALGDIVFTVSSDKVRTFDGMSRSGSARLTTHELINRKPLMEFLGPGGETISMQISFSVYDGLNPEDEAKSLRELRDNGKAVALILGGQPLGDGLWLVESLNETHKHIDNNGAAHQIDVSVTLREYIAKG